MTSRTGWLFSGFLLVALVVSNGWWFYGALDQASIEKYHDQMLWERLEALKSALAALPVVAEPVEPEELVARVAEAVGDSEPYEKEGVTVVGHLTLRFGEDGRLQEAGVTFPIER